MKLRFEEEALRQLADALAYIERDSMAAAQRVAERIQEAAERLTLFPEMGRPGEVAGTREWLVGRYPYILVYEIDEAAGEIVILTVFHGAQDRSRR